MDSSDGCTSVDMHLMPIHYTLKNDLNGIFLCVFYCNKNQKDQR